ncbi:beta-ketoacyl-ACP synthase 3 [Nocardia bovistercoris]|uniref:Beta-ketoacyl-ACP synthase 3 n=1 Tax=Nocardia bovistercoris TaxID=2785916 RepID=A0A931I8C2_9NOCA|nr:beta-ketoacyl-ACP synthase 3 [Nocardia bovistercoris]MBH0776171.1 beta-ketoacyl-ACP synthase 3 [Nocardia bovistercoris]
MTATSAGILTIGTYRPDRIVSNSELIPELGVDEEWILTRTGISERRFANPDETVISMAVESARAALVAADIPPDQVDVVILATSTYTDQTPAAAPAVAAQLGCDHPAAFDLTAGCSGYAHGIGQAAALINAGQADNVLVIGSEKLSPYLDRTERGVAPIFGDGAGAALVTRTETGHIRKTVWGSDGSRSRLIRQEPHWEDLLAPPGAGLPNLRMEGTEVFRWATTTVPRIVTEIAAAADIPLSDVEVFIPHQANLRIIDGVARKLGWNNESVVVADDIRHTGNTSAAALPLAIDDLVKSGRAKPGQLALQVSFGAGLSYAGQVFDLPKVA